MTYLPPLAPPSGAVGPLELTGWDRATLGGFIMPGKARTKGCNVKLKKDKKGKAGSDGSRPTYHGIDPKEFQIEIDTWTDDQRERLVQICRQILPLPGVKSKPLSFDHPSIRHFGMPIKVQVLGAGELEFDNERHTKLSIYVEHWLPASTNPKKSATNTPTRSVRNIRAEDADKLQNPNLPPTDQNNFGVPPVQYTPDPQNYVTAQ